MPDIYCYKTCMPLDKIRPKIGDVYHFKNERVESYMFLHKVPGHDGVYNTIVRVERGRSIVHPTRSTLYSVTGGVGASWGTPIKDPEELETAIFIAKLNGISFKR
jgi:hypothetical protein